MFFKSLNLQKYIFQKTILNSKFKFQAQGSFLEYIFFEIWRSEKRIALSEKKPPLVLETIYVLNKNILQFLSLKSAVYNREQFQIKSGL